MFRRLISALTLVCGLALWAAGSSAAWAERRVALVVGNATYKNTALALPNPRNDASDVSEALRKLDFEVVEAINVDKRGFEMALARFARAAVDADSALFFYAGHAMQYQGRNYLMPTDAELEDEISLRYQMVAIDDVRAALDRVNGVKIMILDACRNNPLAERIARQSNGFTRAVGATRGLARIDKTQGMVVAYATAAEEVAADGNGRNSPFTQALLKRLLEPGLEIEQMFRAIARDVYSNTNGRQRPETYVSLLSEYYLNQADRLAWDKVKDSTDVAALRDFIARFPSSIRALDARYRLEMLERFAREREIEKQRMEREIQARKDAEERARVAEAERLRQETERTKAEQQRVALAERARREREDAERQEREERERLAAEEKARKEADERERVRIATEEAARKEREAREAEGRAKLAAEERAREERQAAERRKVEEAARVAAAEKARKEREEAERRETEQRARVAAAEKARKEREAAEAKIAEERARQVEADRIRREQEVAERRKAEELAKIAAAERAQKEKEAAQQHEDTERVRLAQADRAKLDQVCRQEDERLALLQAAGNGAREEMVRFSNELTCERLRPVVVASLGALTAAPGAAPAPAAASTPMAAPEAAVAGRPDAAASAKPAVPAKPESNTIALITAAQTEMKRLGCFTGKVDGKLTAATKASIHHYLRERELPKGEANVTDVLLKDMKDQSDRVCPIECGRNEIERNGTCVAAPKQKKPAPPMARRQEPARPVARQREPRVASPPPARTPVAAATAPSARPAPKMLGVGF